MKKLVALFFQQNIEEKLFRAFGSSGKKDLTKKEIQEALGTSEVKTLIESGVDPEKIKKMYLSALDKACKQLKKQQEANIDAIVKSLKNKKKK